MAERKPRRPRVQVDADQLEVSLARWKPYVNDVEYLAGVHYLEALRRLESEIPNKVAQSFWRR